MFVWCGEVFFTFFSIVLRLYIQNDTSIMMFGDWRKMNILWWLINPIPPTKENKSRWNQWIWRSAYRQTGCNSTTVGNCMSYATFEYVDRCGFDSFVPFFRFSLASWIKKWEEKKAVDFFIDAYPVFMGFRAYTHTHPSHETSKRFSFFLF